MKHLYKTILALFFVLSITFVNLKAENDGLKINIKISSSDQGFDLESKNGFSIITNGIETINIPENKIHLDEKNGLLITTDTGVYGPYLNSMIKSNDDVTKVGNRRYNGLFYILKDKNDLINHVDLETYLYSVVAGEMGSSFEKEALKAQAIAARSYAMFNLKKYLNNGYNLSNDIYSQVYYGIDNVKDNIKNAVDETKGLFMFSDNKVINAVYSSSNGGAVASSKEVWGNEYSYLDAKFDKYSENTPNVNWKVEISAQKLDNLLSAKTGKTGMKGLKLKKNPFGRVQSVLIIYDDENKEISANKFRSLMGSKGFRSTLFDFNENIKAYMPKTVNTNTVANKQTNSNGVQVIDLFDPTPDNLLNLTSDLNNNSELKFSTTALVSGNSYTFYGKGFGHAVGLSQYGANNMAKDGKSFLDILKFYYSGIEVKKLYD